MGLVKHLHAPPGRCALALTACALALALAAGCQTAQASVLRRSAGAHGGIAAPPAGEHGRSQSAGREVGRGQLHQRVSATLERCVTAAAQSERYATFAGQMSSLPGAERMAMRIDVLEREPGQALFHRVEGPGLGAWRLSEPGVSIFKDVRQVTNLGSPGAYRALVRFHWIGAEGDLVRRARRRTPTCRQPSLQAAGLGSEAATARMPAR